MKPLIPSQWLDPTPVIVPDELRRAIPGSDLLLETLVRRGYSDPRSAQAFLDPDLYQTASPLELPDLSDAVQRILAALANHERIGIWGDFDVDGQTSTAVFVSALRHLDANVIYHIPVRKTESHGILIEPLKAFLSQGVQLLITCDTGISAHEAVDYAQAQGVDVIITDHHSLPAELPRALAVVNPQRLPDKHPLRTLSGVGVAYELIQELCFQTQELIFPSTLLDLVAMGLVADLATLTGDARYLVQRGLQLMQNSTRLALQRIFAENQISPELVNEETIGFVIAPRLNAVGRLGDANLIVDFLLSNDPVFVATTYHLIEGANTERKILCDQVFKGAQAQLEANPRLLERPIILLSHPDWDGGVVGIVASHLVELYHRPAILLNTGDQNLARGSCRSIEGINITEALRENSQLLLSFGGHPMAAGLSLRQENLEALQFGLIASVNQMIARNQIKPSLQINAATDLKMFTLELLQDLSRLAPFGPGNPPLRFVAKNLAVESISQMGKNTEHLLVALVSQDRDNYRFVWWQGAGLPQPEGNFDLLFHARVNNYKGKVDVQFEWEEFRDSQEEVATTRRKGKNPSIDHVDLRSCEAPDQTLTELAKKTPLQIWSEGSTICPMPAKNRLELTKSHSLAIWCIPPSPIVLRQILEKANPSQLYWFASLPPENSLGTLLTQTIKTIKKGFTSENDQVVSLESLAVSQASTIPVMALLLKWLYASGEITLKSIDNEFASISLQKSSSDPMAAQGLQKELIELSKETAAYRQFYLRAEKVDSLYPSL